MIAKRPPLALRLFTLLAHATAVLAALPGGILVALILATAPRGWP